MIHDDDHPVEPDVLRDLGHVYGDVLAGAGGRLVRVEAVLGQDLPVEIQQPREAAHLVEEPAQQDPVVERRMADELRLRRLPDSELQVDLEDD